MQNRLLKALPTADLDALRPHLIHVELPRGSVVQLPGTPHQDVHFIDQGVVSILIDVGGVAFEVGLIGREGMMGVPAVLGSEIADYQGVVRHAGSSFCISVTVLREVMLKRRAIGALVLRFVQAGAAQIAHTAFANARLHVTGRLARWLLMAHDRIDGDTLQVTHEVLAISLGANRPAITAALHDLEGLKAIRLTRGSVAITDRAKLTDEAGPSYGPAEAAYRVLIGA